MTSLLSLSGGADSTTMIPMALSRGNARGVFFHYKQKNYKWEMEAVKKVCDFYRIELTMLDVSNVFYGMGSSLIDESVEIASFDELARDNQVSTIVPNRNMIFASLLVGMALSMKYEQVWMGMNGDDSHTYPDCREDFVTELRSLVSLVSEKTIQFVSPFVGLTKSQVVSKGTSMGVPYELTRSCYSNNRVPCQTCGACRVRSMAFMKMDQEHEHIVRHDRGVL